MLKKHTDFFRRLIIFLDAALVAFAGVIAYFLLNEREELFAPFLYYWTLPVMSAIWVCILFMLGMYDSLRAKSIRQTLWVIFKTSILAFMAFGCMIYFVKAGYISRILIFVTFGIATGLIAFEKVAMILLLRFIRSKGFNFRNIIIVGTGLRARNFISDLHQHRELGLRIIGIVDEDVQVHGQEVQGYRVLGALKDLPAILRSTPVDQVIFVVPRTWLSHIEEAVLYCEMLGVTVNIAVDLFQTKFTLARDENFMGIPMISFEPTPTKVEQLFFKRLLDIFAAGIGMLVLAPVFFISAALVKLTSPGPVFFRQERCSLNGRRFQLIKFRTMVVDAEAKLEELKKFNVMSGPAFKMENDPRVTPIGNFLRKTSLDELPQLWNVLIGEMSLVGPRPPLPKEVDQYDHWQRRRLSMRPGITCLWQVKGRNKITDFNEWMKLDLEYIDNWSFIKDIKILFKTVPVVLFGVGAK